MIKTSKKYICAFFAVVMILSPILTASAATVRPTPPSSNQFIIQGWSPNTYTSNTLNFTVSGIPAGATITNVTVNVGSGSMSGAIVGVSMNVSKDNSAWVQIPWTGTNNSSASTTAFNGQSPNGLYKVNCTGQVVMNTPGNLLNPSPTMAFRSWNNVTLTITYN